MHFGFDETLLATAHATAIAEVGSRYNVIEQTNFSGALGLWEVVYYRAGETIARGRVAAEYQLSVTNVDAGGTTTNTPKAATFHATANIYVGCGGVMHVDDTVATGAPEGESVIITASAAGSVTHTALTAATVVNDDISIHAPYLGMVGAATNGANVIGLALATLTVGQYGFALRRGFHPDAEAVTGTAFAIGGGVMPAANGQFGAYTGAETFPPIGHAVAARLVGEVPANFPVMMTLP